MAICYQYESTYFLAPYVDNQLLCSLCGPRRSGVTPLILWASNTTTRFSSRPSNFCNFTPRIHQKQFQKVRNPKFFLGGHAPRPPSRHPTCALIAYWNPPFQNSRSATAITLLTCWSFQGYKVRWQHYWHKLIQVGSSSCTKCSDSVCCIVLQACDYPIGYQGAGWSGDQQCPIQALSTVHFTPLHQTAICPSPH